MRFYNNLNLSRKLAIGFGLCLLLTSIMGWMAALQMRSLGSTAQQIASGPLPMAVDVSNVIKYMRQVRTRQFQHVLETTPTKKAKFAHGIDEALENAEKALAGVKTQAAQQKDREDLAVFESGWTEYISDHATVMSLSNANNMAEARDLLNGRMKKCIDGPIIGSLDRLLDRAQTQGAGLATGAVRDSGKAVRLILIMVAVTILAGLLIGFVTARSIAGPLQVVCEGMAAIQTECIANLRGGVNALASGDLTQTVDVTLRPILIERKDEVGKLASSYNSTLASIQVIVDDFTRAQSSLRELITNLLETAARVAGASTLVADRSEATRQSARIISASVVDVSTSSSEAAMTSQEIASASEQQARVATQAAESMEDLSVAIGLVQQGGAKAREAADQANEGMKQAAQAVEEVARSGQQMEDAAMQAANIARTGGKTVEQTVESMRRIQEQVQSSVEKVRELNQKGQAIGAIVETIDEIAEQTNLLALNAAIEAARAGENGRGFAVVADEVRKLAERATGATRQIGELIAAVRRDVDEVVLAMQQSSREVVDGAAKSRQAGEALTEILSAANRVARQVESVSAFTEEMNASVDEVLSTVATVREVVEEQEKAATVMARESSEVSESITTVASICQETAAGAEQMSASVQEVSAGARSVSTAVEEQTASVEEVSVTAVQLNEMAAHLEQLVRRFKTEARAGRKPSLNLVPGENIEKRARAA